MKTINLCDKTPVPFTDYDCDLNEIQRRVKFPKDQEFQLFGNPSKDVIYHMGYLGCLAKAYQKHYSVVLSPDYIWFMVLNELAVAIAKNPKEYENLFTTTPGEKQMILVSTFDPTSINPALVIDALKNRVPTDVDTFIPKFSTLTPLGELAFNIAFCDVVSPYYSYGTFMCGIPSVRIEGTPADWTLLRNTLYKVSNLFQGSLNEYLVRCDEWVEKIISNFESNNADFFRKMVRLERCGSGSQFDMDGWILEFLNQKTRKGVQLEGLQPFFTHMDYINIETQRNFSMYAGHFYSKIEDGFLIPCYDAFKFELFDVKPEPTKYVITKGDVGHKLVYSKGLYLPS